MLEFIFGAAILWLLAGLALHVIMLFRNRKFIHNTWRYHAGVIGAPVATVIFVSSLFLSVAVWPHVFFKAKQ